MKLPFSKQQFFYIFYLYNQTIWPVQLLAYLLGFLAVICVLIRLPHRARVIPIVLGVFWVWMGIVYHMRFFSIINPAAYLFGVLFVIQGGIFLWYGVNASLAFSFVGNTKNVFGAILVLYSVLLYPLIGFLLGHRYPASPMFGVAPCPTTIFTFGLLLWTTGKMLLRIYAIALIWSIIGFTAAFLLGVKEDYGLLVAGITGTILLLRNRT